MPAPLVRATRFLAAACALACLGLGTRMASAQAAGTGSDAQSKPKTRIIKVLPHLLDQEGRHSLSPSLFDRDAYQAELRKKPDTVSAVRFDVHWKSMRSSRTPVRLKLELVTNQNPAGNPLTLESEVKRSGWFGTWSSLTLDGDAYRKAGRVIAWRATLWDGETLLSELRSFLW